MRLARLRPEHRPAMLALLDRCSAASLYERFLTHAPAAGARHVESLFTDPDCHTFVVTHKWNLIAFGSLFITQSSAEIALFVGDEHQGQGVGTLLAEHLCAYAATQGIRQLELTALARNHRIAKLFRRCAPTIRFDPPDAGVVTASIRLAPSGSTRVLIQHQAVHIPVAA